jgi:hypothetical protein
MYVHNPQADVQDKSWNVISPFPHTTYLMSYKYIYIYIVSLNLLHVRPSHYTVIKTLCKFISKWCVCACHTMHVYDGRITPGYLQLVVTHRPHAVFSVCLTFPGATRFKLFSSCHQHQLNHHFHNIINYMSIFSLTQSHSSPITTHVTQIMIINKAIVVGTRQCLVILLTEHFRNWTCMWLQKLTRKCPKQQSRQM